MKKIYIRKEIDPTKSLLVTFPEVAAQWHSELNGVLTPDLVTAGSGKKVWWKCSNQHEFNRSIYTQVRFQNCPYCSGKRASQENNLRLLFPEIAKEWHPTLNGKLRPEDVTYASNKKIWWLCKKNMNMMRRLIIEQLLIIIVLFVLDKEHQKRKVLK
jgi:hypothetical protein